MPSINKSILAGSLVLMAVSCIEPYYPGDIEYEPYLFIQASVTDNAAIEPFVQLSNTKPVFGNATQGSEYINTSGAAVFIEREDGSEYWFRESFSTSGNRTGRYVPITPLPPLVEGLSYQLTVVTGDGYVFKSDPEYYLPCPPIDSITYSAVNVTVTEGQRVETGYRFFAHTKAGGDETTYFRWSIDYTYRYFVPFQGDYLWTGSRRIDSTSYKYTFCYMDGRDNGIYVASTSGLSDNRIAGAPLNFVSQYGDYLRVRYSLHASQYRISLSAFSFWFNLRKMMYETGGLYETQPFRLTGNIYCASEKKANVTGIFEIAGVSQKRIFVNQPTVFPTYSDLICKADTIGSRTGIPQWSMVPPGSYLMDLGDGVFMTAPNECFDCRIKGGYLATPPFWELK